MSEPNKKTEKKKSSQGGPHGGRWEEMYQRLVEYKEQHGDCLVPNRYEADPQLGSWVSTQRRHYKLVEAGEPSPMTQQRIEALEKIGFKWSAKSQRHVQWDQRFQALVRFKECYGHTQVPINWEKDVQLANWISTQRQEYQNLMKGKTSRLDEGRIRLLNGIGFSWQLQRGGRKRHLQEINHSSDVAKDETDAKSRTGREKSNTEEGDLRTMLKANPVSAKTEKPLKEEQDRKPAAKKRTEDAKAKTSAPKSREKQAKGHSAKHGPAKSSVELAGKAIDAARRASPPPKETTSLETSKRPAAATRPSNAFTATDDLNWGSLPSESKFLEGVMKHKTGAVKTKSYSLKPAASAAKTNEASTSDLLGSISVSANSSAAAGLSWPSESSILERARMNRTTNYPSLSNDLALALRSTQPTAAAALPDGTAMLIERMAQNQQLSTRLAEQDALLRLSATQSSFPALHSMGLHAGNIHSALSPTNRRTALSSSLLQMPATTRGDAGASSAFLDLATLGSSRPTHFSAYESSIFGGPTSVITAEDRRKFARLAMGSSNPTTSTEVLDRASQQSQAAQLQALIELSRLSGQENAFL